MFTGFGKHKKNLLKHLYKTGKYELFELSNGYPWSDEKIKSTPWESYGSLPDDPEKHKELVSDPARKHGAAYGAEMIDKAINEIKPDIYLGIEDIWAFRGFFEKPWWNKIHCLIHTTLDSLPILNDAVEATKNIKNYFVWATFAEKALHKLGHTHVKTIRGSVDTEEFYRLSDNDRAKLKKIFNLENNFVIGFVFRNQLRKSVPNILDGFKLFYESQPESNAKLLLHTHWSEGWDIVKLIKEKSIDPDKIITTYFCSNCHSYEIKKFEGQKVKCSFCSSPKSCETTNVKQGVDETQLNQIYNLMDVYCHPFTSGGQELPIQEAKLTELITLVTNYSCGEDSCSEESGGLPLEWAEYREPGTQFIKATTYAHSINSQLQKVYNMTDEERSVLGKKARQYIVDNYSIQTVGKVFEDIFDNLPEVDYSFEEHESVKNLFFEPDDNLKDKEWIESLYINILGKVDTKGVDHWIQRLKTDLSRKNVLDYFLKIGIKEDYESRFDLFLEEIRNNPNEKRIAYIEPSGAEEVLIATSLLPTIKKQYPDHKIYCFVKAENFALIDSHPDIEKALIFHPKINNPLFLEGKADSKKYFDVVYAPHLSLNNNYIRNGKDILMYDIYESH